MFHFLNIQFFVVKGSCDFEGDQFCGWIPDPKTDYNWMINSGPGTNWPISGPNYDHTFQSNIGKLKTIIIFIFYFYILMKNVHRLERCAV